MTKEKSVWLTEVPRCTAPITAIRIITFPIPIPIQALRLHPTPVFNFILFCLLSLLQKSSSFCIPTTCSQRQPDLCFSRIRPHLFHTHEIKTTDSQLRLHITTLGSMTHPFNGGIGVARQSITAEISQTKIERGTRIL